MTQWDSSRILFRDREIIVVNKPAGLPVQTKHVGTMDLESILRNELARAEKTAAGSEQPAARKNASGKCRDAQRKPYLAVVHRLDQPVEGLVVFARTPRAAASLSSQLNDGTMKKQYLAVAAGVPAEPAGRLEDYLVRDGRTNRSEAVQKGTPGAKKAVLDYRVAGIFRQSEDQSAGALSLLEIDLHTGRHHQIRVQLAAAGMPVCGDRKYGADMLTCGDRKYGAEYAGSIPEYPALCAQKLTFRHPGSGKIMDFSIQPEGRAFTLPFRAADADIF